jgi:hypothetical protein
MAPQSDTAKPATQGHGEAARSAIVGVNCDSPTTPAANDRVFDEPLNLDDFNDLFADDFYLAKGLNAEELQSGQALGTSSGWLPDNGLATAPFPPAFSLGDLPSPAPAAVVPTAAPQAVDISALVRMAGVESMSTALAASIAATRPAPIGKEVDLQTLDQQGLRFEVNKGQIDTRYAFVAHGPTFNVALSGTDATLALSRSQPDAGPIVLNLHLVGGDPLATAVGQQALPGITNYFGGPGATYTGVVS